MKYCVKCGKELFDEAVICPGCGCVVEVKRIKTPESYEHVIRNSKTYLLVSIALMLLGVVAWLIPGNISSMYAAIMEKIKHGILSERPSMDDYYLVRMLANATGTILFLLAEIIAAIPRNLFNKAYKANNLQLFTTNKTEFKTNAKACSQEMRATNKAFKACSVVMIVAFVLLVISTAI